MYAVCWQLTSDYYFAKLALSTASPDQAGAQGTALSSAIDLAERSFDPENENPVDMQQAGWQAILNQFKQYAEQ